MPSLDAWLNSGTQLTPLSASQRAVLEWRRIQDRPTSLVITRAGVALSAQTVRLEFNNSASLRAGTLVYSGVNTMTVFGVRDHPTIANTNIQRGDRMSVNGVNYEVKTLLTPPGEVQAICEG